MLLRERGFIVTDNAVEVFLRGYRRNYLDCSIPTDDDDRRRNAPRYLYRPEVWPALVAHFARRIRPLTDG
jgi:hypothetical protein